MSEDAGLRLQVSGRVQPLPRQLREGRPTRHEVRGPSAQSASARASIFRQNERLRAPADPVRGSGLPPAVPSPPAPSPGPGPRPGRSAGAYAAGTRPGRCRCGAAGRASALGRRGTPTRPQRPIRSRVSIVDYPRLDSTRQQEQVRAGSEPGPGGAAFGRHTGRADPRGTAPGGLPVTGRGRSPRRAHARPRRPLTPVPLS